MKKAVLIAIVLIGAYWHFHNQPGHVSLGPGVKAPSAPLQQKLVAKNTPLLHKNGYTIKKLRRFKIKAKVVSKTNYHFDREADLSPTDLGVGWGRLSDESNLKYLDVSQSNRFLYWRAEEEAFGVRSCLLPIQKYREIMCGIGPGLAFCSHCVE